MHSGDRLEAISDLNVLIKNMKPKIALAEYVFCVVSEAKFRLMNIKPICTFREREGVTAIIDKASADSNGIHYTGTWKLISISIYSDLHSIGFLAAITAKLAEAGISVNIVSAYHHDHLFVPLEKAQACMQLLKKMSEEVG